MDSPEYDAIAGIVLNGPEPRSDLGEHCYSMQSLQDPTSFPSTYRASFYPKTMRRCKDAKPKIGFAVPPGASAGLRRRREKASMFLRDNEMREKRRNGEKA